MAKKRDERPNEAKKALPLKRGQTTFSAYPEDLYLEKTPGQKHYDPRVHRPFVERDVVWIMRHGVQDAVLVDKLGDKIVPLSGRGRVINTLEANRRLVAEGKERIMLPVVLKRGDPAALFEVSVIVNEHRKADDPVTKAFKFQQYMNMGRNEEEVGALWGVDVQTVKRMLKTLELCPEVQQAITAEAVSYLRAIKWADLSFPGQRLAYADYLEGPKKKSGPKRPSSSKIDRVFAASKLPPVARVAIEWAAGRISDEEAAAEIKGFSLDVDGEPGEDPAQTKFSFAKGAKEQAEAS